MKNPIERTITIEKLADGWIVTEGQQTWNVIFANDEASILYPDGGLRIEHPDDALPQLLGELEVY